MNVAIIPARGGSKRIPEKNSRLFNGRPMIEWSIMTAKQSNCFEKIIVSTDSEHIAEIALRSGAEVQALRPASLSGDFVGSTEVIQHEIKQLRANGWQPEMVCELYATSVLLDEKDLRSSYEVARVSQNFVFSSVPYRSPVQRSFYVRNGVVEMLFPEYFKERSQDLEQVCHDAGQFYWGDADMWLQEDFVFGKKTTPFILSENRVIDIDTMNDWVLAEVLHENKEKFNE